MGLFDKKYCDVCGKQIGLLGNRKLKDGNLCKDCASKLSPWFTGRKASTVSDIKSQLSYREANQNAVKEFVVSREFKGAYNVYVDDTKGNFIVSRSINFRTANPDVISKSAVSSVTCRINEDKDELYEKDAEGKNVSYNPPKFQYSYEFKMVIDVNNPYFDDITFELTSDNPDSPFSDLYKEYIKKANDIAFALTGKECCFEERNSFDGTNAVTAANETLGEGEWLCSECGTKNLENYCSNCGTKKPSAQGVIKFCPFCGYKVPEGTVIKFCPQCGKQF